jgi:hypothetical protein
MSITPDSTNKILTALNEIVILEPVALSFITALKKAIQGNGSMTVDQLIAEAEADWNKAQADLNDLAKKGHE